MTARMRHSRGYSLVELMVASTIGLIVALAVTGAIVATGRQYAMVSANVAAQSSAQIGLSLIDAAGRAAGSGFFANGQTICPSWNAYNGAAVVANGARLLPARIVDGGSAGASDQLVFTGGSGTRPLAAVPVMMNALGANIQVSNSGDWATGDIAVIGAPGSGQPCTLFEVRLAPAVVSACGGNATTCLLLVRTANSGLNPGPTAFSSTPTFGFTTAAPAVGPAVVSRVGSTAQGGFRQDGFAVQCGVLVRYNAFTSPTLPACTSSPLGFGAGVDAIAPDIVLMHAQYGISAGAASDVVTQWVNASGATWGGTPAAADIARIKAVRVVLVARSREADGAEVTAASCTNAAGVVNTGPCSFEDAAAPVIDLSGVAVPAGKSWRHFRYRVHQSVVPLRAVIWSDS
jgi:type IV pilus assembly protein PilW